MGNSGQGLHFLKSGKWLVQLGDNSSGKTGKSEVSCNHDEQDLSGNGESSSLEGADGIDTSADLEDGNRSGVKLEPGFFRPKDKSADSHRSVEWNLRHGDVGVKIPPAGNETEIQVQGRGASTAFTGIKTHDDSFDSHEQGGTPRLCALMRAIMEDVMDPVKAEVHHSPRILCLDSFAINCRFV
jgi:hypothetical protein